MTVAGLSAGPAGALPCELAVIGCGDLQRGDDGVGPLLVRRLREDGIPPGVRLVDGGTAGTDVAWQMRGAKRVIVVDSGRTGAAPGTVYRVPGPKVADMPPLSGLHTHSFRWDHALAFARWLLGPHYPADVTVYLIEALDQTPGDELSAPARDGLTQVLGLIRREFAFREHEPRTHRRPPPFTGRGNSEVSQLLTGHPQAGDRSGRHPTPRFSRTWTWTCPPT